MVDAWRSKGSPLPYSGELDGWTEEHYNIYTFVELARGNRKEVTKEEQEEQEVLDKVDKLIQDGDPNWLDTVKDFLGEGGDLDDLDLDSGFFEEIDEEQRLRGE